MAVDTILPEEVLICTDIRLSSCCRGPVRTWLRQTFKSSCVLARRLRLNHHVLVEKRLKSWHFSANFHTATIGLFHQHVHFRKEFFSRYYKEFRSALRAPYSTVLFPNDDSSTNGSKSTNSAGSQDLLGQQHSAFLPPSDARQCLGLIEALKHPTF